MGAIEKPEQQVACSVHSNQAVVWECDECGKKMCVKCKTIGFKYKIYCETCIEKVETVPIDKLLHPAGFWKRLSARAIDGLILAFLFSMIFLLPIFYFTPIITISAFCLSYIVFFIYHVVFTWQMGQTPGKIALEIEVMGFTKKDISLVQALLRHILGISISLLYVVGMINFYLALQSGMGVDHFASVMDFIREYHRYGITTNTRFVYTLLCVIMFGDSVFILCNKRKRALHDLLAGTRVVLS
ncbi:MAG: RDD family protein [Candidatus Auribacterota bacterium]|jgi:uncharacterized RDD family membrane protein YckC|nr:RDD family protein [Candidatus Auribacterota bacterium]